MNQSAGMTFLAELTRAAIDASRVAPGVQVPPRPGNSTGKVLIRPGGRASYPAVWTQDYYMTLPTGFVTLEEARNHLELIASCQNGPQERVLKSGTIVPAFAIADHILFDGKPIYFPGTYSSGEDQGGEPWGICPPINNYYDFIAIAHHVLNVSRDAAFLRDDINGMALIERLRHAYRVPEHDPETGLIVIRPERRAVGFIFCDSIYMTGRHLMASMLRRRASLHLAELELALDPRVDVAVLKAEAEKIQRNLELFRDPETMGGWLFAASGVGRQADVWGTIYALAHKLLSPASHERALKEVLSAIERGTILHCGAVRHVPTDRNASENSAWERTVTKFNHYQNGAYWHTPTGWLIAALWPAHAPLAQKIFSDMIDHMRAQDFRKGGDFGAPWEYISPDPTIRNNPVFLASVTVPYAVLKELWND